MLAIILISALVFVSCQESEQQEPFTEQAYKNGYFNGNVFQIITQDLGKMPMSAGTGFVFNQDGWFITNAHVMEGCYFATGIFNIPDKEKGEAFTKLEIDSAFYRHQEKDVFIGKLTDYAKLQDYYKNIRFTTEYDIGDEAYSVGYPNASVDLILNKGKVISNLSSLFDKLYSGISYVGFDAVIAHGNSGGILVNNKGEVLGTTTLGFFDDNDVFQYGAAISSFNVLNQIETINDDKTTPLALFIHPDEEIYINNFILAEKNSSPETRVEGYNLSKKFVETNYIGYTYEVSEEGINEDNIDYTITESVMLSSIGIVVYKSSIYWSNGQRRDIVLFGVFSNTNYLDNFQYYFHMSFHVGTDDETFYSVKCDEINYSSNVALTLNKCYVYETSSGVQVSDEHITYAKEQFNYAYEALWNDLELPTE